MADSVRIRRVSEQIRAELSQLLREDVQDPRIGLVTVTRVKLASDLGAATIFYSPLGEDADEARRQELSHAMGAVTGFLRKQLARRMKLRHTPQLRFIFDDSIAEGSHTLAVMRELEISPEAPGQDEGAEASANDALDGADR